MLADRARARPANPGASVSGIPTKKKNSTGPMSIRSPPSRTHYAPSYASPMSCRYEVSNGVGVVTLDRPDVLNAFDDELGFAVLDAVRRASDDPAVRCIVVTGAGRAFSSGEDLGALQADYEKGQAPPLGDTLVNRYNPLIRAIRSAPK